MSENYIIELIDGVYYYLDPETRLIVYTVDEDIEQEDELMSIENIRFVEKDRYGNFQNYGFLGCLTDYFKFNSTFEPPPSEKIKEWYDRFLIETYINMVKAFENNKVSISAKQIENEYCSPACIYIRKL
jgi:hypothetical protein